MADWAATAKALGRKVSTRRTRLAKDLGPAEEELFFAAGLEATTAFARAERDDRRRSRRALRRARRENDEARRRLWNLPGRLKYASFRSPPSMTLEACLRRFTCLEYLDADNSWYCQTCDAKRCARKRIALWRTPDVLIMTLKRFSPLTGRKLDRPVDFPLDNLDLSPFTAHCADNRQDKLSQTYSLFGVVNHFGSAGFGHYTAYVRDVWQSPRFNQQKANQWFRCDDSTVTYVSLFFYLTFFFRPVDASNVCSSAAYVLFYSRDASRPTYCAAAAAAMQDHNNNNNNGAPP